MKKVGEISNFSIQELSQFKPVNFAADEVDAQGKPLCRPASVPLTHQVVAKVEYGDTAEAHFYSCESVEDMQLLHSYHQMRSAAGLDWYCSKK